jgi:hypothetical protein
MSFVRFSRCVLGNREVTLGSNANFMPSDRQSTPVQVRSTAFQWLRLTATCIGHPRPLHARELTCRRHRALSYWPFASTVWSFPSRPHSANTDKHFSALVCIGPGPDIYSVEVQPRIPVSSSPAFTNTSTSNSFFRTQRLISASSLPLYLQRNTTQTFIKMPSSVEYLTTPSEPLNYEADPVAAMSSYSRMMHMHTRQQMESATRSARRRSPPSSAVDAHAQAGLSQSSKHSSNSSRSSF